MGLTNSSTGKNLENNTNFIKGDIGQINSTPPTLVNQLFLIISQGCISIQEIGQEKLLKMLMEFLHIKIKNTFSLIFLVHTH